MISNQIIKIPLYCISRIVVALTLLWQYCISAFFPVSCRFHPSCSNYMLQSIKNHGIKGVFMGIKRILKCNPWF